MNSIIYAIKTSETRTRHIRRYELLQVTDNAIEKVSTKVAKLLNVPINQVYLTFDVTGKVWNGDSRDIQERLAKHLGTAVKVIDIS